MKKLLLSTTTVITLGLLACQNQTKINGEPVSFYEVPLVCGAAPEIGCGSRAKPALLELEKSPAVKEAWLNRPGTVLAIVWNNVDSSDKVAKRIFEKNEIEHDEVDSREAATYSQTFRNPNQWFRGADVDVLSYEEAETIAESSVKLALAQNIITTEEAQKLKGDVTAYFKEELVKIRSNEELNMDSEHKFREDLIKIGQRHIGKERTIKAMALYEKSTRDQCKEEKACNAPGTKKCCDND